MKKQITFFSGTQTGGAELITRTFYKLVNTKHFTKTLVLIGDTNNIDSNEVVFDELLHTKKYKYSLMLLYRFLKKNKPDYVFSSTLGISVPLLLVLFLVKGIKPIIRHSFMPNRYSKCSLTTLVIKLLYPRAYKLIAQTQEMKNLMIDFYNLNPKKISVLNNPIDTIAINEGIKDNNPYLSYTESFNLVTVGNVRFVKGHDILIKAFKLFKDVYENSHLFIIGQFNPTAKYFIEMQNWIDENNLNNYIHFTGFSNNPYKYIYNSSCFVLPSRSEGLPNVLLEAMYLKKPIVATKCIPFIEQVIEDGINGFKVDVDNEIQMADAMIKAVDMDVKESNKYTPATVNEICEIFK